MKKTISSSLTCANNQHVVVTADRFFWCKIKLSHTRESRHKRQKKKIMKIRSRKSNKKNFVLIKRWERDELYDTPISQIHFYHTQLVFSHFLLPQYQFFVVFILCDFFQTQKKIFYIGIFLTFNHFLWWTQTISSNFDRWQIKSKVQ